ncbi:MAG: NUDIX hydrolase [Gemmataceae bacterium]|nr:NUDIX hydrolase [Gemmataceae bacterium]MDW8266843.1 NUDIX hydrolase [Gemmataceae bacterium]
MMAVLSDAIRQAAAIPILSGQVCLITSSSGRRWVVPKGCFEPGKTAADIALQEAWEEAGLIGVLRGEPIGHYHYEKLGRRYHVTVFVLDVTEVADDWPEMKLRQRRWLSGERAIARIQEPDLRDLILEALAARQPA